MSGIYIHGVSMPKDGKVLLIDPWGNVRKHRIHALVNAGQRPHVVVRRPTLAEYVNDPHGDPGGGRR